MSEFGSGIVVPLVKFTEHLTDRRAAKVERAIKWVKADPSERERILGSNEPEWTEFLILEERADSPEALLDEMMMMWAQGASDHLSDLSDRAPESLQNLATKMFELRRHMPGYDEGHLTEEDWVTVLALWSAAAMDIDEILGVKSDWGEW